MNELFNFIFDGEFICGRMNALSLKQCLFLRKAISQNSLDQGQSRKKKFSKLSGSGLKKI